MTSKSIDRAIVGLAIVVYAFLGVWMSERMMVFSEELIGVPTAPWRVAAATPGPDGLLRFEPSCADNVGLALRLSAGRPTLATCVGERTLPLMTAPYFAGVFAWPLELLRGWHHDDPFLLRKLMLPLGALAILLVARVASVFGSSRLAALCALGMAVSPCFVLLYSMLTYFETLPWVMLLVAILLLSRCRELAPGDSDSKSPPPTGRLVAASFFVGLAFLANIKALFYVLPLVAFALRMGVRIRPIRPRQWLSMAITGALPLVPVAIPVVMDPSMSYAADRGSNWRSSLIECLRRPGKVLEALRDLVLFGSNAGAYITRSPVNATAAIVCALVLGFVIFDTVRTWRRREGCVVTAASGSIILAYVAVVTLLYSDFPANFTPLAAVYGVAIGATAFRFTSWATRRWGAALVVAAAALVFVPFAWATVGSIGEFSNVVFVTNQRAERDLTRYLLEHPDGSVVVSVNLLAGGVVDQLSRGRIQTLQLHAFLAPCESGRRDDAVLNACLHDRFRVLLATVGSERSLRVILPTDLSLVRRRDSVGRRQTTQLEAAAAERGLEMRLEQVFRTPRDVPALRLYRVGPSQR